MVVFGKLIRHRITAPVVWIVSLNSKSLCFLCAWSHSDCEGTVNFAVKLRNVFQMSCYSGHTLL